MIALSLNQKKKKYFVAGLFLIVLIFAAFIRFHSLGKIGFWHDEIYHALAARGINQTGAPVIPPAYEYTRASGFSHMVAISFRLFGENEWAARLPSVSASLLCMILSFFLVRYLLGNSTALVFLFLLSVSPLHVFLARSCRMYSVFELFYFLGSLLFFVGYERRLSFFSNYYPKRLVLFEKKYQISVFILGVSALLLFFAYKWHSMSLNFAFVLMVYSLVMILKLSFRHELYLPESKKYISTIVAVILTGIAIYFFFPQKILALANVALYGQGWENPSEHGIHFYRWFLIEEYPFLFFLYPLSVLYFCKIKKKLSFYIVISFVVLFLLHSFAYFTKQERYLFYGMSYFLLGCSPVIAVLIKKLFASINTSFQKYDPLSRVVVYGSVCFALLYLVYPMLNVIKHDYKVSRYYDYKKFYNKIGSTINTNATIISTEWEEYCYYFNEEPDYYLRVRYPFLSRDTSKRIRNIKDLFVAMNAGEDVYLLSRFKNFRVRPYVTEEMQEVIESHFEEIHYTDNPDIRVLKLMRDEA